MPGASEEEAAKVEAKARAHPLFLPPRSCHPHSPSSSLGTRCMPPSRQFAGTNPERGGVVAWWRGGSAGKVGRGALWPHSQTWVNSLQSCHGSA
jgi:hypothetical protein